MGPTVRSPVPNTVPRFRRIFITDLLTLRRAPEDSSCRIITTSNLLQNVTWHHDGQTKLHLTPHVLKGA